MRRTEAAFCDMDRAYFNRYAEGYSPYTAADLELLLADLAVVTQSRPRRWACEVGAADGQFSAALAQRVPGQMSLLGLDIADRVLRRYPFQKLCGNAFQIPLADNVLDLVCYVASLHHLTPFGASLAELDRVLAPGGVVYFMEPNFLHPQRRFFMSQHHLYRHYRPVNDVPIRATELQTTLTVLGIEVVRLRYVNIHFAAPGLLQKLQNTIARLPWPARLQPYVMPWFILIGVKRAADGG